MKYRAKVETTETLPFKGIATTDGINHFSCWVDKDSIEFLVTNVVIEIPTEGIKFGIGYSPLKMRGSATVIGLYDP